MVTLEPMERVATLVVIMKIVKTPPVGDNGAGGGIGASGDVNSGYVNQVDNGMSWAQGNENYYATQDTNHGYRPSVWEQRKHLERLTTFPSDDDYSNGHDYRSNCNQIDEHFQSLALGSVPHFMGVGDRSLS